MFNLRSCGFYIYIYIYKKKKKKKKTEGKKKEKGARKTRTLYTKLNSAHIILGLTIFIRVNDSIFILILNTFMFRSKRKIIRVSISNFNTYPI